MRLPISILLFSVMASAQNDYLTPYEKGNGNQTATYDETIAYYRMLAANFSTISISAEGPTDSGEPLHTVTFDHDAQIGSSANKATLLINNGIHPGEPDGIDATMMLFRDLALGRIAVPKNVVVVTIPVYNIGGALNRNSHSRTNQNGPESYGFRGNARNYDLNRDFVKSDSRNARSFAGIFHKFNPDVFIDNHVSNGADYQYTFTYIATQPQKLGGKLGMFWRNEMLPELLKDLKRKNIESVPYVNIHDRTPDAGFEEFMDYPRYSTGYASMFNTIGSMPETHMLKDYASRVAVTYEYMVTTIGYLEKNFSRVKKLRAQNLAMYKAGQNYTLKWEIDKTVPGEIDFLGYEGAEKASDISGKPRLYYDQSRPFRKKIPYFSTFKPTVQVKIPKSYIIPKAWWNVIELLKQNNIVMEQLSSDREILVESYRIGDYKTSSYAYEGHYPHNTISLQTEKKMIAFRKGDYLISTSQPGLKYLLETLEPLANDSFFVWNFFDSILQQKEYYSAYVFEDLAKRLLEKDAKLRSDFERKKKSDAKFAESGAAQIDWIYKNSEHYEKSHLQYPVYRITD
ncbi:MAG: M14 family metallopeptidase [Flavobacterium sp.]|nr:M14 family metallopeptidase [Flavobacterium sp.]